MKDVRGREGGREASQQQIPLPQTRFRCCHKQTDGRLANRITTALTHKEESELAECAFLHHSCLKRRPSATPTDGCGQLRDIASQSRNRTTRCNTYMRLVKRRNRWWGRPQHVITFPSNFRLDCSKRGRMMQSVAGAKVTITGPRKSSKCALLKPGKVVYEQKLYIYVYLL